MSESRRRPTPHRVTVLRTERLGPHLVRVVLRGPALATGFEPVHADSYVKVVFTSPGVHYPDPLDLDEVRRVLPAEHWPRLRSYTVRAFDAARAELTLDFVVHGDAGIAGPWAQQAAPGDVVHLLGPGGAYRPDAPAHLLVGDLSALPAIAVALERIPEQVPVRALVEVEGPADELPLARPVQWVHRTGAPGTALIEAATAVPPGPGTQAFVHGEAGFVKVLRRWLRVDQGLAPEQLSVSGYWRLGVDDEGWRASKAQWNAAVAAEESAAV